MALDTANKRLSAIHLGSPWRGLLPIPDGTLNQGDRQHVMFFYSGILAEAPATITIFGLEYTAPALLMHYTAQKLLMHYTAEENDA